MTVDDTEMDPVCQRNLGPLAERRSNRRRTSLAIGRNAADPHRCIPRSTPRVLAEHDRDALAQHLGSCSPDELKHDRIAAGEANPDLLLQKPITGWPAIPTGYVAVPEINVRAAAGSGAWNEESEQT